MGHLLVRFIGGGRGDLHSTRSGLARHDFQFAANRLPRGAAGALHFHRAAISSSKPGIDPYAVAHARAGSPRDPFGSVADAGVSSLLRRSGARAGGSPRNRARRGSSPHGGTSGSRVLDSHRPGPPSCPHPGKGALQVLSWGFTIGLFPYVFLRQLPRLLGLSPPWGTELDRLFELSIPLILLFIVARYRFLDIDIIIRRSLIYGILASALVAVCLVLGFLISGRILSPENPASWVVSSHHRDGSRILVSAAPWGHCRLGGSIVLQVEPQLPDRAKYIAPGSGKRIQHRGGHASPRSFSGHIARTNRSWRTHRMPRPSMRGRNAGYCDHGTLRDRLAVAIRRG